MLGLRFRARAFSSCGKRGPLFIAVRGPLTIAASLAAEHGLQTRRLSSCGSWAQLLHGTWDLPRPGLEPVSLALAGRFSTTAPPGKPFFNYFCLRFWLILPSRLLACYFFLIHNWNTFDFYFQPFWATWFSLYHSSIAYGHTLLQLKCDGFLFNGLFTTFTVIDRFCLNSAIIFYICGFWFYLFIHIIYLCLVFSLHCFSVYISFQ